LAITVLKTPTGWTLWGNFFRPHWVFERSTISQFCSLCSFRVSDMSKSYIIEGPMDNN